MSAGYGVNAYFDTLDSFKLMFIMITLFCFPLYVYYGTGVGLKGWVSFNTMSRFTMGNLGGSSVICKHQMLTRGTLRLFCPPNSVIDARNIQYGVLSNQNEYHDQCHSKVVDEELSENGFTNCKSVLDDVKLKETFLNKCH